MVFEALIFLSVPSSSAPTAGPASSVVATRSVSNRIMRVSFRGNEMESEGTVAPLRAGAQPCRAAASPLDRDVRRRLPHVDMRARRRSRNHTPRGDEGYAGFAEVLHERATLRAVRM